MRKLILHMLMSVDGFISDNHDAVNPEAQWDSEMHGFYLDLFNEAGGVMFGRRLYEQYALHWAKVAAGAIPPETPLELRWAQRLQHMDKHVITTSRPELAPNTWILDGDISQRIAGLKRQAGGDLLLMCGPALFARLTADRLIDQYMLYICPSALGTGNHLFSELPRYLKLDYLRTVSFRTGVNLHYYEPIYPTDSAPDAIRARVDSQESSSSVKPV